MTAEQRAARAAAAHAVREAQRAHLEAMSYAEWRERCLKLNARFNRCAGRVVAQPPPEEVMQAMYDERLTAFDEGRV